MLRRRWFVVLTALLILFSLSFSLKAQIRFAWLSDTHVGSTTAASDLRRAVWDINSMNDIDFTILSGDATETGKNSELELAKSILVSLLRPYHIIPGNHDTKWSESGCTVFSKLWGSDKFAFEYAGYRFIGLDQGPIMRMGDGHFAPEDLRWLDSQLAGLSDKDQPLIFVTHYPVDQSISNWYELLDRAKHFNTKAILVGHGHRNRVYDFEGIPGVMGRSSLRRNDPAGGFTIVQITADSVYFFERITGVETRPAWHTLSLERRDYLADTTRYERPRFFINEEYPHVKVEWVYETGYTIASAPAVWEDFVLAGNSSGTVYGLSLPDGTERWTFKTGAGVYSSPDVSDGRVVFGSADSNVYCLDVIDGSLLWKHTTGVPVVAAPRIVGRAVYIGGSDHTFRAFDLYTGELNWKFDEVREFVETKPLVYEGKVVFGAWDIYLYALNANDGSLAWKWSNGRPGVLFSPAACWPVGADGKVFFAAPDRFMTAVAIETGETIWRTNWHKVREAVGISEDGRRIYARCMTDTLLAFSSTASSPQLLWKSSCGYGYDIDPSMPIEKDGVVFFGTKNGLVTAVDGESGLVKWKHRVGVGLVNTVAPVDGKRVVVTDFDGRVMMVGYL